MMGRLWVPKAPAIIRVREYDRHVCDMLMATELVGFGTILGGNPIGTPTIFVNATGADSGYTRTGTTTADIAAGQLVALAFCYSSNNNVLVDSMSVGSLTLTSSGQINDGGGINHSALFYGVAASAIASGAGITIQLHVNDGGANWAMMGLQASGIIASPADKAVTGNSTNAASITIATESLAIANELLVGCYSWWQTGSPTYSGASGFTNLIDSGIVGSNTRSILDYKIVAATSSVNFVPTWSVAGRVSGVLASFKGN